MRTIPLAVAHCFACACLAVATGILPVRTAAQPSSTPQDRSQMGEGEARITTRSDVRVGIESGPGTSGIRLRAMMTAVQGAVARIRGCYADLTAEHPELAGRIRLRVAASRGRISEVQVAADEIQQTALLRCVRKAISSGDYSAIDRIARVVVNLQFTNSAAQGVQTVKRRQHAAQRVDVRASKDGGLEASGGVPSGEVRFVVRAPKGTTEAAVAQAQRAIRTAIAGLLDCRRRAGRRGMDPQGTLVSRVMLAARNRPRVQEVEDTVEDPRAPTCVARILRRASFAGDTARQFDVHTRFGGR